MANYMIQDTTLAGIADAIRAKTGGTDPIPVPDMKTLISGISSGGLPAGIAECEVQTLTPEADTNEALTFSLDMEEMPTHIMIAADFPSVVARSFVAYYGGFPAEDSAGDGTIVYSDLIKDLTSNTKRNEKIAEDIKALINSDETVRILVLSDRVEHLSTLREMLSGYKVRQLMALSNSKKAREERRQALKDLNDGKINVVLATYQLAREGLDIPNLNYLVMASPVKDPITVEQSVGRVGRKAEGKDYGTCIDYTDDFGMLRGFSKKRNSVYKKLEYEIM